MEPHDTTRLALPKGRMESGVLELLADAGIRGAWGDYGIGPNHTLPTGGTAGFASGLSVFSFLRRPTWIELDPRRDGYEAVLRDAAKLAGVEGLAGHARAARLRLVDRDPRPT